MSLIYESNSLLSSLWDVIYVPLYCAVSQILYKNKKSKYNIVMCDKEFHELLIQESHINCIFCNKQIQDPGKPQRLYETDQRRFYRV